MGSVAIHETEGVVRVKINGEKLKSEMKKNGLTQEALAEKINVNRAIISYWINGGRGASCSSVRALAKELDVDLEYLTDGETVHYDGSDVIKGTLAVLQNSYGHGCPGGECEKCPFFLEENCYDKLVEEYINLLKRKGLCE